VVGPRNIEISGESQDVLPPAAPETIATEKSDRR
jgi:hypothetical protein